MKLYRIGMAYRDRYVGRMVYVIYAVAADAGAAESMAKEDNTARGYSSKKYVSSLELIASEFDRKPASLLLELE